MVKLVKRLFPALLILLVVAFVAPLPDVSYTTVTTVKIGGSLGSAVDFLAKLGGGSTDQTETVYLKGNKMLRAASESSTLIDLDAGRMTMIDHEQKTYSILSFEDMKRQFQSLAESATEVRQPDETEEQEEPDASTTTDVKFDLEVDPTGQKNTIAGHPAEQYFMTLTIEGTSTTTEGGQEKTHEGTMVVASELWMSTALNNYDEFETFNRTLAEKFGEMMAGAAGTPDLGSAMQQAFAGDPRIKQGLEKAQAEAMEMEGTEVKNTTHIVVVSAGETFDRNLAFGEKKEEAKEEKRAGGLFGRVAKKLAEEAAGAKSSSDEQAEAPSQQTLMTLTTEMQDYSTETVSASVFDVPADYKLVEQEMN